MLRTLNRLLLLVAALASISMFAASAAPAREFRIVAARLTREGPVTVRSGLATIRCTVRMIGEVGGQIRKVIGTVIGRITEARTERCEGGTLTPARLPWNKRYNGFTGFLPNITGFRALIDRHWRVEALGVTCEYGPSMAGTLVLPEGGTFRIDESVRIRSESGGLCPEVSEGGGLAVNAPIRMTLI